MIVGILVKTIIIIIRGPNTKVMDPYTDFVFFFLVHILHSFSTSSHFKPCSTTSWINTLNTLYSFLFFLTFPPHFGHPPIPNHQPALSYHLRHFKPAKQIVVNCCSHGSITHSEESAIYPLLHTSTHRWPWFWHKVSGKKNNKKNRIKNRMKIYLHWN